MVAFSKIAFVALAGAATATPVSQQTGSLALFDQFKTAPTRWVSQGAAPAQKMIHAQIGLKQSNMDKLQAKLLDISNPKSKNYGKWLSKDELNALVAPPKANVDAVKAWLAQHGITEVSQPSPDWIEFSVPVSKMESLIDAKYEMYKHTSQNISAARTKQYSVPKELHSVIDMITPTTTFHENLTPIAQQPKHNGHSKRQSCDGTQNTPACIKSLYNVDYTPKGKGAVGATLLDAQAASHSDYATFGRSYVRGGLKDFKDVSVSGGSNPGFGGNNDLGEGNLDTQYIGGLASPIPAQLIAAGPSGGDSAFADQLSNFGSWLTSASNPPNSVSTSYGDTESNYPGDYMDRVCNEFMKAGSRGISVFFSSGDSGVAGNKQPSCDQGFYGVFPASCPWSTAVGGTQFEGGQESVAQFQSIGGSSGGGFSGHFQVPDYQKDDTSSYQQGLGQDYDGYYDPNGRGWPDVSLVAENYAVIVNGQTAGIGGTSASAPAVAAFFATLNDYRISNGKPTLGFVNPLLYGNGRSALRDVTSGSNTGCGTDGYPATEGWDAATGLGTIDYAALRKLI